MFRMLIVFSCLFMCGSLNATEPTCVYNQYTHVVEIEFKDSTDHVLVLEIIDEGNNNTFNVKITYGPANARLVKLHSSVCQRVDVHQFKVTGNAGNDAIILNTLTNEFTSLGTGGVWGSLVYSEHGADWVYVNPFAKAFVDLGTSNGGSEAAYLSNFDDECTSTTNTAVVWGNDGNDWIFLGPSGVNNLGHNVLAGKGHDLVYFGSNGNDACTGGEGGDFLFGAEGENAIDAYALVVSDFDFVFIDGDDHGTYWMDILVANSGDAIYYDVIDDVTIY
jgi:hypothetical protein